MLMFLFFSVDDYTRGRRREQGRRQKRQEEESTLATSTRRPHQVRQCCIAVRVVLLLVALHGLAVCRVCIPVVFFQAQADAQGNKRNASFSCGFHLAYIPSSFAPIHGLHPVTWFPCGTPWQPREAQTGAQRAAGVDPAHIQPHVRAPGYAPSLPPGLVSSLAPNMFPSSGL